MLRPLHLLFALGVFIVILGFASTQNQFTRGQYLKAYFQAKRMIKGAERSHDRTRGGRCSQWRGSRSGRSIRGAFRNRGNRNGGNGFGNGNGNGNGNFGNGNGNAGFGNVGFGNGIFGNGTLGDLADLIQGFNGTFNNGTRTFVIGNDTVVFANGTLTFPNGTQIVINVGNFPVNGQNVQLLSLNNIAVAENGLIIAETTRSIRNAISAANLDPVNALDTNRRPRRIDQDCPFTAATNGQCDQTYPYRTADGTCNNQRVPLLGSSNTPLGRYLAADYSDGIDLPRQNGIAGSPLPGARLISTNFHTLSTPEDRDNELTHLAPVFGLFLSSDISNYATFPTTGDDVLDNLDCCESNDTAICYPIEVPEDDSYFGQYEKSCMPYVRTLPSPLLNCALGSRQQLNLATSYIDASQIYGSDTETQTSLRTLTGGRLLTQTTDSLDLLPTDDSSYCAAEENSCFLSGDRRVNMEPMTMSLHNLFFREHNRIADMLSAGHSNWTDEVIFQEARKIVIAEIQHITYGEYVPKILGDDNMELYSLRPLVNGTTQYSGNIDPNARNSFATAGVLSSHSGIRSSVTIGGIEYPLSSIFFNPDVFYEGTDAPTLVFRGLTTDLSQMIDRLMTDELTNKLAESTPGNGWDQAALNIQTGRDHGLPTYVSWRQWCGLTVPENFTSLIDHNNEAQTILEQVYTNVEDIDLWSGAVSERNIDGGRVGPTFACLIGRQLQAVKFGDRFWYEHGRQFLFSPDELDSIRTVSLSRIICDNTNVGEIQADPFLQVSDANPLLPCDDIQPVDICPFVREWTDWGAWTDCLDNLTTSNRTCTGPLEGACSCTEEVMEMRTRPCNLQFVVA